MQITNEKTSYDECIGRLLVLKNRIHRPFDYHYIHLHTVMLFPSQIEVQQRQEAEDQYNAVDTFDILVYCCSFILVVAGQPLSQHLRELISITMIQDLYYAERIRIQMHHILHYLYYLNQKIFYCLKISSRFDYCLISIYGLT